VFSSATVTSSRSQHNRQALSCGGGGAREGRVRRDARRSFLNNRRLRHGPDVSLTRIASTAIHRHVVSSCACGSSTAIQDSRLNPTGEPLSRHLRTSAARPTGESTISFTRALPTRTITVPQVEDGARSLGDPIAGAQADVCCQSVRRGMPRSASNWVRRTRTVSQHTNGDDFTIARLRRSRDFSTVARACVVGRAHQRARRGARDPLWLRPFLTLYRLPPHHGKTRERVRRSLARSGRTGERAGPEAQ